MSEERDSLELNARDASAIHATINSRGWLEIIKPALDMRNKALISEFAVAATYEEFVRIQQMINAIDGLTNFIEVKLIEGKSALKELRN